jgi:formamidopyrimidine-DNA glycosylase
VPELPEVENIAQGLRNEVLSLCIKDIYVKKPIVLRGPFARHWRQAVKQFTGCSITKITRRGKRLILCTDSELALLIQLGMTGRFLLSENSAPLEKHTHFIIKFNDNRQLRFVDPRRFGKVWLIEHAQENDLDQAMLNAGMSKMGPEPFDITMRQFRQLLESKRVIKTLLLDQTRIAGLGNIYVDEALFQARIHPSTSACVINSLQTNKLRNTIRSLLKSAISHGGTTFSDFRNAYGDMGSFKKRLKVYQRNGLPCPRCQTPIARMVITGRGTHFCPQCQEKK